MREDIEKILNQTDKDGDGKWIKIEYVPCATNEMQTHFDKEGLLEALMKFLSEEKKRIVKELIDEWKCYPFGEISKKDIINIVEGK